MPGKIVAPGIFAGRIAQLEALERTLFQTKNFNPQHFLLLGERGIGKSSLLLYLSLVASGQIESLGGSSFAFVPVTLELEASFSYEDIIKKMGSALQRTLVEHERLKNLAKGAWDFLSCWKVMGVSYERKDHQIAQGKHELLDELADSLIKAASTVSSKRLDGILLLIDEADKPLASARLGQLCKLLTERLSKSGCNNVALGLSGLPSLIDRRRLRRADHRESEDGEGQSIHHHP